MDKKNDSEKVVENPGMGELSKRSTSQLCLWLYFSLWGPRPSDMTYTDRQYSINGFKICKNFLLMVSLSRPRALQSSKFAQNMSRE